MPAKKRTSHHEGINPERLHKVDIVADVVKIRFVSEEELEKVARLHNFGSLDSCFAELAQRSVRREGDDWVVKLLFRITVFYVDADGHDRRATRLATFEKSLELPSGIDTRTWQPVVEVQDVSCDAHVLLDGHFSTTAKAEVHFGLIVKGLRREEIAVFTPDAAD